MREIEFRIRNLAEDRFEDLANITITLDNKGIEIYKNNGSVLDDYELNQYTGLKDKNGKEVYEGDIVKEQRRRFKDKYFAVKWNNDIGSYIFEPLDKSLTSYPCFNIGTVKGLEVIGNIYENPELLEE